MSVESFFYSVTIAIHVGCGTLAVLLGLAQLVREPGGPRHRRLGRQFVALLCGVVTTAVIGLVVFQFRAFLAVLTLLVAYWTFSGVRAVRMRDRGPTAVDGVVALTALTAVATFVVFLPYVRLPWVAPITYSTLGTLALVASYDLTRFVFPQRWFVHLWRYEHIVKMTGAHAAVVAAFAGTVLAAWQPYSQIVPSMIWTMLQIGLVVREYRRHSLVPLDARASR